ncbi:hypothetical protein [Ochrobactrum sp. A-1]|uniref:hypothetical protein n=1 Tax=Ochrobactrum sp. A-1 TaxID=2920940 RepID=UPI001F0B11B0|nr:hypothetical protein [Ochrobactrum sp. A-1]
MASELKPCPFCQYKAHEWIRGNKKMACCDNMDCPCRAIVCTVEQWNTRPAPAATDTGLETVAKVDSRLGDMSRLSIIDRPLSIGTEVCLRSQAEKLLAAERAENTRLQSENDAQADQISELQMTPWPEWATKVLAVIRKRSGYDGYGDAIEGVDLPAELDECIAAIEADNAALTARVKELAEALDKQRELDNESTLHHYNRAEALEAKLAAAERALEPFVSFFNEAMKGFTEGYAERTPSDKPVLGWNNAYLLMRHFVEARAVLGGKPS